MDKHFNSREYVDEIEATRRALKRKEITKEEYAEKIGGIIDNELGMRWSAFEREFCALIGAECDFRTLLIYDENVITASVENEK